MTWAVTRLPGLSGPAEGSIVTRRRRHARRVVADRRRPGRGRPGRRPVLPHPPGRLREGRARPGRHLDLRRLQQGHVRPEAARHGQPAASSRSPRGRASPESAVPADAVTASASGLDPRHQPRLRGAAGRPGRPGDRAAGRRSRSWWREATDGRVLGFLGEPTVNVTELNLAVADAQRAEDDDAVTRRGELRIYLGAAPGVGKTFAMLGEAHRRLERGTDVVVGLVETHGRAKTADLLEGLEVVPRRDRRGTALDEMDLDAVLARRPEVVLVDELAHTNAPGSRHPKRWQDVEELLDAGHRRALHGQRPAPGVAQRRRRADHRRAPAGDRARRGRPPRRAARAGRHHPRGAAPPARPRQRLRRREGSTPRWPTTSSPATSPRCASWRCCGWPTRSTSRCSATAPSKNVTETWETRERVVVALTGDQESETVLRRAARIAKRSGAADLLAVHVLRGDGLAGRPGRRRSRGCARLAEDVGATFHTVVGGEDVPTALLDFARGVNATQLVIGTSRRSRLARTFAEGVGTRVVQDSGHDRRAHGHPRRGRARAAAARAARGPLSRCAGSLGWVLAVVLPAVATVARCAAAAKRSGCPPTSSLFFLATVLVGAGRRTGPGVRRGAGRRLAAQLLPHPAAVLLHDRRAGERYHPRRHGARGSAGGARGRPRGAARTAGRTSPGRGRAARVLRPDRAHPHRPAPAVAGEGA